MRDSIVTTIRLACLSLRPFQDIPEEEEWACYASDRNQNSFYFASDMVISAGVLEAAGETNPAKAFDKIMREVLDVSETMVDFLLCLMSAIVARHCGAELMSPQVGTGIRIDNAPELHDVSIPFFTEANKRPRHRQQRRGCARNRFSPIN